jgi:hypothetical protein
MIANAKDAGGAASAAWSMRRAGPGPSQVTELLLIIGGSVFGVLGLLHAVYTFADARRPRRLAPDDPAVVEAMRSSGLRLSRGGTTMWRAWLGFNFSHSLGVLLFSFGCVTLGLFARAVALPKSVLLLPVGVGSIYLWLAIRYWFRIPAVGIALATLCFMAAWIAY